MAIFYGQVSLAKGEEVMSIKTYLEQAFHVDSKINLKMEQAMAMRELASQSTRYLSKTSIKKTPNPHATQELIAKMMDLENEINQSIDELIDLKSDLVKVIEKLADGDLVKVLTFRYVLLLPWEEISGRMNLSISYAHRLHNRAIKLLDQMDEAKERERNE